MGQQLSNREYIKKIIFNILENNKISKLEGQKLAQVMFSFDQQDWQNFIIIGKEEVNEFFDHKIEKLKIPGQWKNQAKQLSRALVNFSVAALSPEFIIESIQCEKLKIPLEQRPNRLLPSITNQIRVMATRKPASTAVDYKTENGLRKKYDQIEALAISLFLSKITEADGWTKVKKILSLIKSLTPGEVKILRGKYREIVKEVLDKDKYTNYVLAQYPTSKDFVLAMIDLLDAVLEENLTSESIKIIVEGLEIFIEKVDFSSAPSDFAGAFKWGKENSSLILESMAQETNKRGFESRLLKLVQNLTQHLNLLAGKEDSQISDAAEQELARKLWEAKTESENNNSEEENSLGFISPLSVISDMKIQQDPANPQYPPTLIDFMKLIKEKFSNITLTEPSWYERPWILGITIVGVLVIGGFIGWLIFRRKKKQTFQEKED